MEFEDLLNRLNDAGSRGRYMTEAFFINLFRIHIESQGKTLIDESNDRSLFFDAFAPEGFDNFNSPTFIEFTSVTSLKKLIWRLNTYRNSDSTSSDTQLLIVSTKPFSKKTLEEAHKDISNTNYWTVRSSR